MSTWIYFWLFHADFIQKLLPVDPLMCVAAVALYIAYLFYFYVLLLLSLLIVQLRLWTSNKVYDDDDDDDDDMSNDRTSSGSEFQADGLA